MPKKDKVSDLPYNLSAEKAVIGSAFLKNEALYTIMSELDEDDFYDGKNIVLFRVIKDLVNKRINVDTITVTNELINLKELDFVGGVKYLQECTDSMVAISSLQHYINIVKDNSVLRHMLTSIRDIDKKYHESEISDINEFIVESEESFKAAIEKRRVASFISMREIAQAVSLSIENQQDPDGKGIIGLSTGYSNLDKITQGLKPDELIILAARPSVGKTALALNFAYNVALNSNKKSSVAIFSIEMSNDLLGKRLLAMDSNVPLQSVSSGKFNGNQKASVSRSIKKLLDARIFIDETGGINILDIITKSRQLQAENPDLSLIVIDYLGLITTNSKANESLSQQIGKITGQLKALAKEMHIPIVVLCQLSRQLENREDKRPIMSDLRDSGNIEQDADIILLMYREDYYGKDSKRNQDKRKFKDTSASERKEMTREQAMRQYAESNMTNQTSLTEINVAKNRQGQTARCYLFFAKEVGKFMEPPEGFEEEIKKIMEG